MRSRSAELAANSGKLLTQNIVAGKSSDSLVWLDFGVSNTELPRDGVG